MQKDRKSTWMGIAGIALVVGFFMPWIDLGGLVSVSGWDLVRDSHISLGTRVIFALCPILGAALAFAAFGGSRNAAKVSIAAGLGVLGYTGFKIAYTFAKITGWGLWLVLAAGVVALIFGLAARANRP
jgi:hypothetical protein